MTPMTTLSYKWPLYDAVDSDPDTTLEPRFPCNDMMLPAMSAVTYAIQTDAFPCHFAHNLISTLVVCGVLKPTHYKRNPTIFLDRKDAKTPREYVD